MGVPGRSCRLRSRFGNMRRSSQLDIADRGSCHRRLGPGWPVPGDDHHRRLHRPAAQASPNHGPRWHGLWDRLCHRPLGGGAFTSGPGWRWCFYVNLPCGALVFALLVLLLQIPPEMLRRKPETLTEKAKRLDPLGATFFPACVICLLLALQWGGLEYSWSDVRIIVLFILSGLLLVAFVLVQRWRGDVALIPGRIFFNRSVLAGAWFSFFTGAALQTLLYYLPIWFQAIKGSSPIRSGILILPMVIGIVVSSLSAGLLTKKLGYYTPWMILSSVLSPIGAGLITTITPSTSGGALIGYQALAGLGIGFERSNPPLRRRRSLRARTSPSVHL